MDQAPIGLGNLPYGSLQSHAQPGHFGWQRILLAPATGLFADMADGLLKDNESNKYLIRTNISQKALDGV